MRQRKKYKRYPRYMFPRKDYHRIPRVELLKQYAILRYMVSENMPSGNVIDFETMKRTMRDKHFFNGISVNLLSKFKIKDAVFFISDHELTAYWNFKSLAPVVPKKLVQYNANQGYYGFRIGDVEEIKSTFDVFNDKCKRIRTDEVYCKVEHWPTRVNFWHFNIFLWGVEKRADGSLYKYRLNERFKENKVKNIAANLMEEFYKRLLTKSELYEFHIPTHLYRKGKKWRRFVKRNHITF